MFLILSVVVVAVSAFLTIMLMNQSTPLDVLKDAEPDSRAVGETFRPRLMAENPEDPVLQVPVISALESRVRDLEYVVGVRVGDQARAYPINMLSDPKVEILNDELGGLPIAVTWCDLCQAALVFDREIDGQVLTLFVTRAIWKGNMVMADVETSSAWLQLTGQCKAGEFKGKTLRPVSSVVLDWASWREANPTTTVLNLPRVTGNYVHHPDFSGFPAEAQFFDRFVVGVALDDVTRTWRFAQLRRNPVLNEQVGEQPLVVSFDRRSSSARVFDRRVGSQLLTFQQDANSTDLIDDLTGTRWNQVTGLAVEGTLINEQLKPIPATVTLEEAWQRIYNSIEY